MGTLIVNPTDENAQPIARRLVVSVAGLAGRKRASRAEGADGDITNFVFELPAGQYELRVRARGFAETTTPVSVPAKGQLLVKPTLPREAAGSGDKSEAKLVDGRFKSYVEARVGSKGKFPVDARERALQHKQHMLDPDVINAGVLLTPVSNPMPMSSFGSVESFFRVEPRGRRSTMRRQLIKIPYETQKLGWVDPSTLRVFEFDAKARRFRLVEDSGPDPDHDCAYAYIDRHGVYGVIGLPGDSAVLDTVRTFCRLGPTAQSGEMDALKRRICQLILCSGESPGQPKQLMPPGGLEMNACDFCEALKLPPGGLPECDIEPSPPPPPGPPPMGACDWLSVGPRNINGRIRTMAIHPNDGGRVFAGTANAGVWATADGGLSWTPLMFQEGALEIGALAVHLTDPGIPAGDVTVFAGTGESTSWPGYKGVGVLKSTASGKPGSWTATGAIASPGGDRFAAIVIDPTSVTANPATTVLYAGGPGGLFKSINGGTAWTPVLISGVSKSIQGLALDPVNPAIIYAAVAFEGIYKFDPVMLTWATFNTGIAALPQLALIAIGASAPHTMYAKLDQTVYKYNPGINSWQSLGNHGGTTYGYWSNVLMVDPQDSKIVFAGGFAFERTYDGGTTWQTPGIGHEDQHAMVFDTTNHLNAYVGNDGGVFRGTYTMASDTGTWSKRSDGLTISHLNSVGAAMSIGPDLVGAGVQDNGTIRTTGGLTWDSLGIGGDGSDFIIDPTNPLTVYGQLTTVGVNSRPYKSVDGGQSFAPANTGFPDGPFVGKMVLDAGSPPDPNRVLFVAGSGGKVYRTTNSAGSWSASSPALGGGAPSAMAVSPSNSAVVYAGSDIGKVWRSSDNGATVGNWKDITAGNIAGSAALPVRRVSDIVVHPTDPNTVYVSFSGFNGSPAAHVFKGVSADGWTTWSWQDISSNLPDIPVNALEINPAAAGTLWAGSDTGVFRTTDGGISWAPFDAGLPNVVIADLALNAAGDVLRAAAYGYSLWETRLLAMCPQEDVYIRDNKLDTGEGSSLSGVPDPTNPGGWVNWWESVDIKVDAYPYFPVPTDGVEFDLAVHENPVRNDAAHPNPNRLYVQVHNRGPLPAHNVKVEVLYADASAGLPALPSDFWSSFPNAWTAASPWSPVDLAVPFRNVPTLLPHTPAIVTWDWVLPVTAADHTCMLAVISSDEDAVTRSDAIPNDHLLWIVVPDDKHVGLKNLQVVNGSIPPPGGGAPMGAALELNNASSIGGFFDVVFDPGTLPLGTRVSLLLPRFEARSRLEKIPGGVPIGQVVGGKGWWRKASGLGRAAWKHEVRLSDGLKTDPCIGRRAATIPGLFIRGNDKLRCAIVLKLNQRARPGGVYRCVLTQRSGPVVIGGSTFEIRIDPRTKVVRMPGS